MAVSGQSFNVARKHFVDGDFDWVADSVYGAAILRGAWTPNKDDDTVQTALTAGAIVRAEAAITGKMTALDDANDRSTMTCDTINVGAFTGTYNGVLIYRRVSGTASANWLICVYDLGATFTNATSATTVFGIPAGGILEMT